MPPGPLLHSTRTATAFDCPARTTWLMSTAKGCVQASGLPQIGAGRASTRSPLTQTWQAVATAPNTSHAAFASAAATNELRYHATPR
jgi:hypothetical protein